MEKKFEIGDRIIYKPANYVGTISGINREKDGYIILYDDEEEYYYVHYDDLEFENPKQTFLTRLQELLAAFDAKIESVAQGSEESWIDIYFSKEHIISFISGEGCYGVAITAENVFDYIKE